MQSSQQYSDRFVISNFGILLKMSAFTRFITQQVFVLHALQPCTLRTRDIPVFVFTRYERSAYYLSTLRLGFAANEAFLLRSSLILFLRTSIFSPDELEISSDRFYFYTCNWNLIIIATYRHFLLT